MNENFSYLYKQTSKKLRMLSALSKELTPDCISKIYRAMILPPLMYNCTTMLDLTSGQIHKLESIQRRAEEISNTPQKNIANTMKEKSVLLVKKCLHGLLCDDFTDYFQFNTHSKATRNKNLFLKIPKLRLEFARLGFFSMVVKKL